MRKTDKSLMDEINRAICAGILIAVEFMRTKSFKSCLVVLQNSDFILKYA